MALTLDLGVFCGACAMFYFGMRNIGTNEKEMLHMQYMQIVSKWMFLTTALVETFEIMLAYNGLTTSPELLYLFSAFLILWIIVFVLDLVLLLPRFVETLRKRVKK